jgi:hypothetical protein
MVPRPGTAAVSTTAVDPDAEVDDLVVDDVAVDEVVVVELLAVVELLQAATTTPAITSASPIPARRIPRRGLSLGPCVGVRTMITLPVRARFLHGRPKQPAPRNELRASASIGLPVRTPPWLNHCIDTHR